MEDFLNHEETPILELSQSIPIIISVEESNALYVDKYRGKLSDISSISPELLPIWIDEWIVRV
jgi:hypothetical protein